MAKYLFEASYLSEGVNGLLKEGGTRRREAVDELFRSLGGTVLTAPAGQDAFFTYYDQTNTVITIPATGGLSATQMALITSVKVTLRIKATNARVGNAVTIVNTVLLPNVMVTKVTS